MDDYKLERALGRLNALIFEINDFQYYSKPFQGQILIYSMRISIAVTSTVADNLGWRGIVRPMQNPQLIAPAYGWGLRIQVCDFVDGDYLLPTFTPRLIGQGSA